MVYTRGPRPLLRLVKIESICLLLGIPSWNALYYAKFHWSLNKTKYSILFLKINNISDMFATHFPYQLDSLLIVLNL